MQSFWNLRLALGLLSLMVLANSQGVVKENYALSEDNPESCDTIVEASTFSGDCCALNSTQGLGCVLNVVNGRCIVSEY
jgi:hypothetical protein